MSDVAAVIIGRNEGARLVACLESLRGCAAQAVYVDSASADGSPAVARAAGFEVVELDGTQPLTAAHARNAGLQRVRTLWPRAQFVQFIDGDCRMEPGWLDLGAQTLRQRPELAVVCGRCRELAPEVSVYNRLCDVEWNQPAGEATWCGGLAMMRIEMFQQTGGFRDDLAAAEENDLCLRFMAAGWKIWRLEATMAWHDAAMTRLSQWWRRTRRSGHAFAQGAAVHHTDAPGYFRRELRSGWFWGLLLPLITAVVAVFTHGWGLLLLALYPLLAVRVFVHTRRGGTALGPAAAYAFFCVLGKLPQMLGQAGYVLRPRGRPNYHKKIAVR